MVTPPPHALEQIREQLLTRQAALALLCAGLGEPKYLRALAALESAIGAIDREIDKDVS